MKKLLLHPPCHAPLSIVMLMILLIALVGFVAMDMYFPSLPAIARAYQVTPGVAQLTLTYFLIGFGFSQLFYGPCSDYFGRRPVLLVGFSIFILGSIELLAAHTLSAIFIARCIQGVGAGAGNSLCRVLLRDYFVGDTMAKVGSYLTIGVALTTALSPAIGGFVQDEMGYRGNFVLMLLFGGLVTLIVFLYLPESNHTPKSSFQLSQVLQNYRDTLLNKYFISNMLCSGLALSGLLAYAIINPFLLQNDLNISAKNYGLYTVFIASGEFVGTYINGRYVTRLGYRTMTYVGIALLLCAGLMLLSASVMNFFTILTVAIPTFILTMSIGIIIPNATAGAFSAIYTSIGTAGAVFGCFQVLLVIVETYFISCALEQTAWNLGMIFFILAVVSLLIYSLDGLETKRFFAAANERSSRKF